MPGRSPSVEATTRLPEHRVGPDPQGTRSDELGGVVAERVDCASSAMNSSL